MSSRNACYRCLSSHKRRGLPVFLEKDESGDFLREPDFDKAFEEWWSSTGERCTFCAIMTGEPEIEVGGRLGAVPCDCPYVVEHLVCRDGSDYHA